MDHEHKLTPISLIFYGYANIRFKAGYIINYKLCKSENWHQLSEDNRDNIILGIENIIYTKCIEKSWDNNRAPTWDCLEFKNMYDISLFEVVCSLSDNTNFRDRIISGEIKPLEVGSLSWNDMNIVDEDITKTIDTRKNQKITKKIITMYKCGKCHRREAKPPSEVRASLKGDESSATIITCNYCGNQWSVRI